MEMHEKMETYDSEKASRRDDGLIWKKTEEKHLVNNRWIDFRESVWRFPDGMKIGPFYTFSRQDYVVIAARDEDGRYLTVRQFRQGIEHVTREYPAGGIERDEEPLAAAKRELEEETGYISDEWRFVSRIPSNPTMADNYAYIFYAGNCRRASSQKLDVTEFVDVELIEEDDLADMIRRDAFEQPVHVMAYYRTKEIM